MRLLLPSVTFAQERAAVAEAERVHMSFPLQIARRKFQGIFNLLHGKSENHHGSRRCDGSDFRQREDTNYTNCHQSDAIIRVN